MFFNPVVMAPFLGVLLIALVTSMAPRPLLTFCCALCAVLLAIPVIFAIVSAIEAGGVSFG